MARQTIWSAVIKFEQFFNCFPQGGCQNIYLKLSHSLGEFPEKSVGFSWASTVSLRKCENTNLITSDPSVKFFLLLSILFLFTPGPRVGEASGLLRPGPSGVCDEDSPIWHGWRPSGRNDRWHGEASLPNTYLLHFD